LARWEGGTPRPKPVEAGSQGAAATGGGNDRGGGGEELEGGLRLGYTINLNLPATTEIEVFNAIFKSLRENLLRK
jgi:hypothetical protein